MGFKDFMDDEQAKEQAEREAQELAELEAQSASEDDEDFEEQVNKPSPKEIAANLWEKIRPHWVKLAVGTAAVAVIGGGGYWFVSSINAQGQIIDSCTAAVKKAPELINQVQNLGSDSVSLINESNDPIKSLNFNKVKENRALVKNLEQAASDAQALPRVASKCDDVDLSQNVVDNYNEIIDKYNKLNEAYTSLRTALDVFQTDAFCATVNTDMDKIKNGIEQIKSEAKEALAQPVPDISRLPNEAQQEFKESLDSNTKGINEALDKLTKSSNNVNCDNKDQVEKARKQVKTINDTQESLSRFISARSMILSSMEMSLQSAGQSSTNQ